MVYKNQFCSLLDDLLGRFSFYFLFPNLSLSLTIFVIRLHLQYAAREAEIVAQAGRKHAITISTNMAGRGTDIILGGNPKVHVAIR